MRILSFLGAVVFFSVNSQAASPPLPTTPTGIVMDTAWKKSVYDFAVTHSSHPAWGLSHSERDYQVTVGLSHSEGIAVDTDVLFAGAFLHDIGGLPPYEQAGVDHAVRSVQVIEPLLHQWGFPDSKWTSVRDIILGHTYYGSKATTPLGNAFRDADILDFLGTIGIARILAVTEDAPHPSMTLKPGIDLLTHFRSTFEDKLTFASSKLMARNRLKEMDSFFQSLSRESFDGKAL